MSENNNTQIQISQEYQNSDSKIEYSFHFNSFSGNYENKPKSPTKDYKKPIIQEPSFESGFFSDILFETLSDQQNETSLYFSPQENKDYTLATPANEFVCDYSEQNSDELAKKENNKKSDSKISKNSTSNITPLKDDEKIVIIPSITNIVAIVNLHCELNLKRIALKAKNIEFDKTKNFLKMDLKNTNSKALILSSGKMRVTGVKSKEELRQVLKLYKSVIKKCYYPSIKIYMKEVKYVLFTGTYDAKFKISFEKLKKCLLDFDKKIQIKTQNSKKKIFPAVIYKKNLKESNLTLTIFSSGKINITGAKSEQDIQDEINRIYPELLKCKI